MKEELREFGLTDNEIEIFLTLLRFGTITPAKIAEKVGFSRSYVYDALERLQEKGLVSFIMIDNKKNYTAINPKRLQVLAEQKLENIQKIIPSLEKIKSETKTNISVELYKGKHIYKTLLRDIISSLEKDEEVYIFGIDDTVLPELDKHTMTSLRLYFEAAKRKNIKEKAIVHRETKTLKEAKHTCEYRFLNKKHIGNVAFEVYGNKVAIFFWSEPNHLILIESQEVADSYKKQFMLLWSIAKEK